MAETRQNLQTCNGCGEQASGPDSKSVSAAMLRHAKKCKKGEKR